tara:strand:+ start:332 stop:1330 length:999 start_codon:yes stop_codon:yes gene_type:complete
MIGIKKILLRVDVMKVLVTGAAGFIGINLCARLLTEGHEVVGLDNFSGKYDDYDYKKNAEFLESNPKAKFVDGNIVQADLFDSLAEENITHIVHLAAKSGVRDSVKHPKVYLEVNIIGSQNVLDFAVKNGIKNVVLASTSSVYGTNKTPFNETMQTNTPLSPYAASKVSMEALAHSYYIVHKLPVTLLRFFTVYGPKGRRDMAVYKFAKAISDGKQLPVYGDGLQKRDFTYIGDIVDALIPAMNIDSGFNIYNIGNDNPRNVNELIDLLSKYLEKPAKKEFEEPKPTDPTETRADISKAKNELGYSPKTSLDEGVRLFVEWFKEYEEKKKHP